MLNHSRLFFFKKALGIKKEDFKFNLDDKLGVELDDGNIELSGGQAQLIAILRAIYKNVTIEKVESNYSKELSSKENVNTGYSMKKLLVKYLLSK